MGIGNPEALVGLENVISALRHNVAYEIAFIALAQMKTRLLEQPFIRTARQIAGQRKIAR